MPLVSVLPQHQFICISLYWFVYYKFSPPSKIVQGNFAQRHPTNTPVMKTPHKSLFAPVSTGGRPSSVNNSRSLLKINFNQQRNNAGSIQNIDQLRPNMQNVKVSHCSFFVVGENIVLFAWCFSTRWMLVYRWNSITHSISFLLAYFFRLVIIDAT